MQELQLSGDKMTRINIVCIFLVALILFDTGIIISLADVGGTWKIYGFDADRMVLTQVGTHVYGTYDTHQGLGTIDGTINAQNVWAGTWSEPFNDDNGYFSATFSNDTSYMYGNWKYAHDDNADWDGDFLGEKVVAGNTTKMP
jgi:hypothetical protein